VSNNNELVTPKARAKHKLLFNKLASAYFALVAENLNSIEGTTSCGKTLILLGQIFMLVTSQ
jgi:hypothetical protein